MGKRYKIYPGIGIARIGNSNEWHIGPESPSDPLGGLLKDGKRLPFKDSDGLIKKQGVRFRVYEFNDDEVVDEVTASSFVKIQWTVHLANKKAASKVFPDENRDRNPGYDREGLVIGKKDTITGENRHKKIQSSIKFKKNGVIKAKGDVVLGHLRTDDKGRLIVTGGDGNSMSPSPLNMPLTNAFNNDGWYDDCCDGKISATITINNKSKQDAEGAWVVIAPPAYAPEIHNVVTWYDHARDVWYNGEYSGQSPKKPSFTKDIFPILKRADLLQWVSGSARGGHKGYVMSSQNLQMLSDINSNGGKSERKHIFNKLMDPKDAGGASGPQQRPELFSPKNMPYLNSGIDPNNNRIGLSIRYRYASLTQLQYDMMQQWSQNNFVNDWNGEPAPVKFNSLSLDEQPDALTEAALVACHGEPFYPGIECTYIMALKSTYKEPYRIDDSKHEPGDITELMAVPWQADFMACSANWWPAQRPVSVLEESPQAPVEFSRGISNGKDMVKHWYRLGFIVKETNNEIETYLETERENF